MWVFNVWLYLCFIFAPAQYQGLRQAGAPCYVYLWGQGEDPGPPPVCFYEVSNGQ